MELHPAFQAALDPSRPSSGGQSRNLLDAAMRRYLTGEPWTPWDK